MENINKGIAFARSIPQNKWDRGKHLEMWENILKERLESLEKFKTNWEKNKFLLRGRGISEVEIENMRFAATHEHITLLERVIEAQQKLEWLDKGLRELTYEKIRLLESMITK